jgi:hypothetical protein
MNDSSHQPFVAIEKVRSVWFWVYPARQAYLMVSFGLSEAVPHAAKMAHIARDRMSGEVQGSFKIELQSKAIEI